MFAPRTNKFSYLIPVFDGGLNTKFVNTNTPPNQSPDLQNVDFDDHGAVSTVDGYTVFNPVAIGTAVIDGLHSYVNNAGTRELLAACKGSIWRASGNTFVTVGSSQSQYTAGQDVNMITVESEVYIQNGYIKAYRWNGGDYLQVGVSAPTSGTVSAVSDGTGALNGSYEWYMTGVNTAGVEGDYSELTSVAVTITNGQANLSEIYEYPASAGVVEKYIYRNTAGVASVPYRVTSITNLISAMTDNVADSSISTAPPSDNGTPPKCKFQVFHRGRIFAAGDPDFATRLWYSNQGDPEIWASTNYVDVGKGDGEKITAIRVYSNSVIIHKNDGKGRGSIWLLYMPDTEDISTSSNWYLVKSPSAYGAQSNKAIDFFSNLMFFLNRYGAYAFTGTDLALSSADSSIGSFSVDSHTFDIEPDVYAFKETLLDKAAAITYDNKVWLAVPSGTSSTENDKIYKYDFVRASDPNRTVGAWSRQSGPGVNNFTAHDGMLYAGSSTADGFIYQLDTGTNFNSSAISSYFTTIPISALPEHRDYTKVFRYLEILVSTPGDWPLYCTYWVDFYNEVGVTTSIDLNSGSNLWGTFVWGTGKWQAGTDKERKRIVLYGAVGKAIKFKFWTNTADQYFTLHELELKYNLRRIR